MSSSFSCFGLRSSPMRRLQNVASSSSLPTFATLNAPSKPSPTDEGSAGWSAGASASARARIASRSSFVHSSGFCSAPSASALGSVSPLSPSFSSLNRSSAPNRKIEASSSFENIFLTAPLSFPTTVRPVVSMRWMTRWSSTIFLLARSRMSSSTLLLVMKRYMFTVSFWPMRCARDWACRSFCGFQSLSKMITVSAVARLMPRPPARVESRNAKSELPSALKWSMAWCRCVAEVEPSRRWKWKPRPRM
mmetsp:Transcript_25148/g.86125  ORF Transcript_25148/g.86125 Transcript_25148/m.86125 type:complete len:249 (-) Transcript_25148:1693-2439(-)